MMIFLKDFFGMMLQFFGSLSCVLLVCLTILLLVVFRRRLPGAMALSVFLLCLLLALNPFSQWLLSRVLQEHLYWRVFWLLPVPVLVGVLLTGFSQRLKGAAGLLPLAALLMVLLLTGKNVWSGGNFTRPDNPYKLPSEAAAVSAWIVSDAGDAKVLVPDDLFCYIRQYSSRLRLLYGRNIAGFTAPVTNERILAIHGLMNEPSYRIRRLLANARKYSCDYVVFLADRPKTVRPERYNYEYQTTIGNYEIYKYCPDR